LLDDASGQDDGIPFAFFQAGESTEQASKVRGSLLRSSLLNDSPINQNVFDCFH